MAGRGRLRGGDRPGRAGARATRSSSRPPGCRGAVRRRPAPEQLRRVAAGGARTAAPPLPAGARAAGRAAGGAGRACPGDRVRRADPARGPAAGGGLPGPDAAPRRPRRPGQGAQGLPRVRRDPGARAERRAVGGDPPGLRGAAAAGRRAGPRAGSWPDGAARPAPARRAGGPAGPPDRAVAGRRGRRGQAGAGDRRARRRQDAAGGGVPLLVRAPRGGDRRGALLPGGGGARLRAGGRLAPFGAAGRAPGTARPGPAGRARPPAP